MNIKHIETNTLIDYPNKIASIIFFGGCNFDCKYCFNRALVEKVDQIPSISPSYCLSILEKKRKYLDGVVISGGEPTIQSGLMSFIQSVKEIGLDVKLDTNGYNPDVLETLISTIDYIAMDIKAPIEFYNKVTCVNIDTKKIERSINLIKNSGKEYEFRSTVWINHPIHLFPEKLRDILIGVDNYYLQNFDDKLETGFYNPLSKKDVNEIIKKLEGTAKNIELRGLWN